MESNFFLQSSKCHRFDDFDIESIDEPEMKRLFQTFQRNMDEVLYVVQSSFNLMVHAKLDRG